MRSLNNEQLAKVMRPLNDFVFSECSRDNANLDFADVAREGLLHANQTAGEAL